MILGKFMTKNHNIVSKTIYFSIVMQLLTTLISFDGFRYKLKKEDKILTYILFLETLVQIIEGCFYVWVIFALSNLKIMSSRRYIDWYLTTPMMLFTTIIFMEYQKNLKNNDNKIITLHNFIKENKKQILIIFSLNFLMLSFGLMNELNYMNVFNAVIIGTIFFLINFYYIYQEYANYTDIGIKLFYFLFIVWGLYGVAACLNNTYKNTMYNCLDIIAKNFYGLFIYYYIKNLYN